MAAARAREDSALLDGDTDDLLAFSDTGPPKSFLSRLCLNKWFILTAILVIVTAVIAGVLVYAFVYSPIGSHFVVINARIFTSSPDPACKWAEAMVIDQEGVIIFVGTTQTAKKYVGRKSQLVDAGGKLILPGFIDAHVHPVDGGVEHLGCVLYDAENVAEILGLVKAFVARNPNRTWVVGAGWEMAIFPEGNPSKTLLDNITSIPTFLLAADGHSAWVNSAAFKVAGITKATKDPPGGRIERDPQTGEPSGTLRESAVHLFDDFLPEITRADYAHGLRMALALANENGITSMIEANADDAIIQAYKDVLMAGNLTARMTISMFWDLDKGVGQIPELVKKRNETFTEAQRPNCQIRAVKLFLDGVIESMTAAVLEPYVGTNITGILDFSQEDLYAVVEALTRAGLQLHMHAIGDKAIRLGLDAIEATSINFAAPERPTMAHLELINKDDIPRFQNLGVVANFQPFWFIQDGSIVNLTIPLLGPERSNWLYPFRSVLNTSARVACGSDWSVTSISPLGGIQNAVTRRIDEAAPAWLPEQRSTVEQAALCYTREAAFVAFRDNVGILEQGLLADFVILDQNIFDIDPMNIEVTKVLYTYLGGKLVWDHTSPSILVPG